MRKTERDPGNEADLRTLKSTIKRATIDYVTWAGSRPTGIPGLKFSSKPGLTILNDVTPEVLAKLPPELLERPISSLEVSVDFAPRQKLPRATRARHIIDTYLVLFRRLAPWKHPLIGDRIYKRSATEGDHVAPPEPGGIDLHFEHERWSPPSHPRYNGNTITAETVYYGHALEDRAVVAGGTTRPMAQVRLYIKVTDRAKPLPQEQFRTRVEVTLSGAALHDELDARTIEDLFTAPLNKLAGPFLPLVRPCYSKWVRRPQRLGKLSRPMQGVIRLGRKACAERGVRDFLVKGAAGVRDVSGVELTSVPELESAIKRPLESYRANAQRHSKRLRRP